jgi:hypothetical protein
MISVFGYPELNRVLRVPLKDALSPRGEAFAENPQRDLFLKAAAKRGVDLDRNVVQFRHGDSIVNSIRPEVNRFLARRCDAENDA